MEQDAGISSLPLFISNSVSFHVSTIHRMCPTSRRQYADFLVFLTSPLHRQYKTARTETRWHLLLKTGQMPIQTSASRGYVLFSGANKGHSQKSLNCLRLADTPPECSKLGKTRIIADGKHGRIRNSVFCAPNVHAPGLIWNVVLSDFFSVIYDIAVRSRDSLILWRHRQHPGICCADILPCD